MMQNLRKLRDIFDERARERKTNASNNVELICGGGGGTKGVIVGASPTLKFDA